MNKIGRNINTLILLDTH